MLTLDSSLITSNLVEPVALELIKSLTVKFAITFLTPAAKVPSSTLAVPLITETAS